MVRKFIGIVLVSLGLTSIIYFVKSTSQPVNAASEYAEAVKSYQELSIDQVENKLANKDSFFLYVGRESCQYCRAFVPKLSQTVEQTQQTVYYLDSEEDPTGQLEQFLKASGIETVPSLLYIEGGKAVSILQKGSQATIEEIEQFFAQFDK